MGQYILSLSSIMAINPAVVAEFREGGRKSILGQGFRDFSIEYLLLYQMNLLYTCLAEGFFFFEIHV